MSNSLPLSPSDRQLQLIAEKSHPVGQRVDPHAQGQHRRMSSEWTVVEKDWIRRSIRCLQSRRHFSRMKRIAIAVGIAGNDQRCWIINALSDLVIRRITSQRFEVFAVFRSSELLAPHVRVIEEVIA